MLDPTPPVCVEYRVRDGWLRLLDQDYQHDPTTVKVQWKSALFDLESLIDHFEVMLVDSSTGDAVAGPFDVSKDTNYAFSLLDLQHTQRVHTVVTAVNRAGVEVQCGTNGILVDLTPAEPQSLASNPVMDGNPGVIGFLGEDLEYTFATRSAFASWKSFVDAESDVAYFYVWAEATNGTMLSDRVFANRLVREWTLPIPVRQHGERYRVGVRVVNGAGNARDFRSNAVEVDETLPEFVEPVEFSITPDSIGLDANIITDTQAEVQLSVTVKDEESGIAMCRFALGSYPDGSDLSGVITVDAADLGASAVMRTRGGYEICTRLGVCTDIEESHHEVFPSLNTTRIMNDGVPLLNGFTMYAWVACLNGYVTVLAVADRP